MNSGKRQIKTLYYYYYLFLIFIIYLFYHLFVEVDRFSFKDAFLKYNLIKKLKRF